EASAELRSLSRGQRSEVMRSLTRGALAEGPAGLEKRGAAERTDKKGRFALGERGVLQGIQGGVVRELRVVQHEAERPRPRARPQRLARRAHRHRTQHAGRRGKRADPRRIWRNET